MNFNFTIKTRNRKEVFGTRIYHGVCDSFDSRDQKIRVYRSEFRIGAKHFFVELHDWIDFKHFDAEERVRLEIEGFDPSTLRVV